MTKPEILSRLYTKWTKTTVYQIKIYTYYLRRSSQLPIIYCATYNARTFLSLTIQHTRAIKGWLKFITSITRTIRSSAEI